MRFKIDPGELKHKISIERYIDGKNDDKMPTKNWGLLLETKAKIINVRGDEFLKAQAIGSSISKTFYIRYRRSHNITNKDRIVYNGVYYNILYVNDVEERRLWLELKAEVLK